MATEEVPKVETDAPTEVDPVQEPKELPEEKNVIPAHPEVVEPVVAVAPPPEEKNDDSKALVAVKEAPEDVEEKAGEGSTNRDAVLARVATEKRMSLVRAWVESEKSKAENKAQKKAFANPKSRSIIIPFSSLISDIILEQFDVLKSSKLSTLVPPPMSDTSKLMNQGHFNDVSGKFKTKAKSVPPEGSVATVEGSMLSFPEKRLKCIAEARKALDREEEEIRAEIAALKKGKEKEDISEEEAELKKKKEAATEGRPKKRLKSMVLSKNKGKKAAVVEPESSEGDDSKDLKKKMKKVVDSDDDKRTESD